MRRHVHRGQPYFEAVVLECCCAVLRFHDRPSTRFSSTRLFYGELTIRVLSHKIQLDSEDVVLRWKREEKSNRTPPHRLDDTNNPRDVADANQLPTS
ncbi:unnamed protein product [Protopolystoma xenopodis]|uniref:Uncharacterized protein n=1 Tax=Protopolystoma xenopodis TaxID=117903 RepID=A0A3S5C858_9PLAT|nr:unnamed protein product [Protopolystoma xenopodis]